jgi:hypothetical protein
MTGSTGTGDVHRPEQVDGELPLDLLRRELLEVTRIVGPGVVDEHVDGAEAIDGRRDRRLGVLPARDVELHDQQVVGVPDGRCHGVRVAAGRNDVVACGQRRFGEVDAHAAAGTGDEPGLLGSCHGFREAPFRAE